MRKLMNIANQYVWESDWKVIAVLKFCLLSLGILFGMKVPDKYKKPVQYGCFLVFVVTYFPLIGKLVSMLIRDDDFEDEDEED